MQNKYDTIKEFASGAMRQLNNTLDQAVIAEYSNAGKTVDDGKNVAVKKFGYLLETLVKSFVLTPKLV